MTRIAGPLLSGIVVGLLAGAAVGFVVFGRASERVVERADVASPSDASRDGSLASAASSSERSPAPNADAVRVAIAALRKPEAPAPAGVISGAVLDTAGAPVPGVHVAAARTSSAERSDRRSGIGPSARSPLEDRVRRAVATMVEEDAERREATTGADGRYSLEGIGNGAYELQASREGFSIQLGGGMTRAKAGDAVDFVASPLVRVPVAVTMPNGSAAMEAWIHFRPTVRASRWIPAAEPVEPWSADAPAVWIKPGRYDVRALSDDPRNPSSRGEALVSESKKAKLALGVAAEPLQLALRPMIGVRGRVTFPADETTDNAQLRLVPTAAGQTPDFTRRAGESAWTQRIDPHYAFRDVPPGTYAIGVVRGGLEATPVVAAVVEIRDRTVEQDVVIPPMDPNQCLVARVYGPGGELASDVQFDMRLQSPRNSRSNAAPFVLRTDGSAWVSPPADLVAIWKSNWDSSAHLYLCAQSDEFGKKEVELEPGRADVEIRYAETATLEVTLPGYRGSGLEGVLALDLRLPRSGDEQRSLYGGVGGKTLEGEDRVTLGPTETGDYEVIVLAAARRGGWGEQIAVSATPVSLHAGENALTLPLPALFALTVRVPDGKPAESATLQSLPGAMSRVWLRRQLDENAKTVFENLPAGEYRIDCAGKSMRVRVTASAEIVFESQPQNALVVSVTDPSGALATAGFQDGDRIVAIDGKEFSSPNEALAALSSAIPKKKATMRVQRGRSTVDIEFDPTPMTTGGGLGGRIEPGAR